MSIISDPRFATKPNTEPTEPTGPIGIGGVGGNPVTVLARLFLVSLIMLVLRATTEPLLTPTPALVEPHNQS